MIFKIDHLAACVERYGEAVERFASLGFRLTFMDTGLPNPAIKRSLMAEYSGLHGIALLSSPGNINIELVDHGHISGREGYLVPVFSKLLKGTGGKEIRLAERTFYAGALNFANIAYYGLAADETDTIRFAGVYIRTQDLYQSARFWSLLGFKQISAQDDLIVLEFQSLPDRKPFRIFLHEDPSGFHRHDLDDYGFNCIAMASNSPAGEKAFLDHANILTTAIEGIRVNKKDLSVFFVKGPSNELVEIIGLSKN